MEVAATTVPAVLAGYRREGLGVFCDKVVGSKRLQRVQAQKLIITLLDTVEFVISLSPYEDSKSLVDLNVLGIEGRSYIRIGLTRKHRRRYTGPEHYHSAEFERFLARLSQVHGAWSKQEEDRKNFSQTESAVEHVTENAVQTITISIGYKSAPLLENHYVITIRERSKNIKAAC